MAIQFKTREQLKLSTKVDVQGELEGSNPFLRNSFLGSIVSAFAFRIFDVYEQMKELIKQFMWDTAQGEFLQRAASWFGITINAAEQSFGNVVAEGTATTLIPAATKLVISNVLYTSQLDSTITAQVLSVSSLTATGTTARAVFTGPHGLASGITIIMAGANEVEYNGSFIINVDLENEFTYETLTTPSGSPATGTITSTATIAVVNLLSDSVGVDTNQDSGAALTFQTPISGVNNTAYVDFGGITSGVDQENSEDFRIRFLDRVQNPVANFNVPAIRKQVFSVAGNTRAFVHEITPAVGQVTIYFTRDDDGIIPNPADVVETKDAVLVIKPANTANVDVIVLAPVAKVINFVFSVLSPNTSTMQAAIQNNLEAFFEDDTEVGADLEESAYTSAIYNTIDTETGNRITSFTLTTPTGNQSVAAGEIATLGTITYP